MSEQAFRNIDDVLERGQLRSPARSTHTQTYTQQWALFSIAAACMAGLLAWYSAAEYRRIEQNELRHMENTAQLIEEAVGRQITAVKRALDSVREAYQDWNLTKDGTQESVQYLKAMQGAMPGIRSFLVLDRNGTILTMNRAEFIGKNFQSRDYFQVVLKSPNPDTLYLTPPFKSALGVWTMALSQSFSDRDSPFAGVVAGTLEQTEFHHLLTAARYAPDLHLGLFQESDNRFVSVPDNAEFSDKHAAGLNIVRTFSPAEIKLSTPLTLRLSRNRESLFAPWQERLQWSAGLLLAAFITFAALLLLWQRRQRVQDAIVATYEAQLLADQLALQRSEAHNRLIVSAVNVGAMEVDLATGQARCDAVWYSLLGHTENAFPVTLDNWYWLVYPEDVDKAREYITKLPDEPETTRLELRLRDRAESWHWFAIHGRMVDPQGSTASRLILAHIDIAKRKAGEETLRANEERIRSLLASMQDLVIFIDTGCVIQEYHQPAGQPAYFNNADTLVGSDYAAALPAEVAGPLGESIVNIMMNQEATAFEYELQQQDGARSYHCVVSGVLGESKGFPLGFLVVVRDVTLLKAAEAKILNLALYDTLTNLPNRRLLDDRISQALAVSARDYFYGAVMFLDLDRFKQLNDNHGHDAGDALLCEVANRLQAQVRASDTVARLGGDEFVVMLETLHKEPGQAHKIAESIAEKIRQALCLPYVMQTTAGTVNWECSSSIGVTLFQGNAVSAEELFKRADQSMYVAKKAGRNQIVFPVAA